MAIAIFVGDLCAPSSRDVFAAVRGTTTRRDKLC